MASCTLSGLLAISIADSFDPLAYLVHGGPSPLLLIGAGVLLPEPVACSGSFDAGACDGSERPIRRREPCLPE